MKDEKKSFIVYSDIEEVLNEITDEEVGRLFRAMVAYSNTGQTQDLGMPLKYIFIPIRQQMDRDLAKWNGVKEQRSKAGKKGGAPKGNTNASRNKTLQEELQPEIKNKQNKQRQTKQAKQAVNVNVNGNVTGNGNVIKDGPGPAALSSSLISYLNERTGSEHQTSDALTNRVAELLDEGYTPEDFREVIDKKTEEWLGVPLMRPYLRPSTLFGDKFPQYAAEPDTKGTNRYETEYAKTNMDPRKLEALLGPGGRN